MRSCQVTLTVWLLGFLLLLGGLGCASAKYAQAAHGEAAPGGDPGYGDTDGYEDNDADGVVDEMDYAETGEEAYGAEAPPPPPAPGPGADDSKMVVDAPEPISAERAIGRSSGARVKKSEERRVAQNRERTEASPTGAAGQPSGGKPFEAGVEPTKGPALPIFQMLIYTATLHMAVFEVDAALSAVEDLAREMDGFLARRSDQEITIRVPTERFDDAMKRISKQGDVIHRNVEVEDVSEEFLDVSLRLKNAREVRDRIAKLLESATTVEDSLRVERELHRLSAEIERLEGRLKYLRDRAQYSTITVRFQPLHQSEVDPGSFRLPFPWLRQLGLGRLMELRSNR